jgi:hypothetical protein
MAARLSAFLTSHSPVVCPWQTHPTTPRADSRSNPLRLSVTSIERRVQAACTPTNCRRSRAASRRTAAGERDREPARSSTRLPALAFRPAAPREPRDEAEPRFYLSVLPAIRSGRQLQHLWIIENPVRDRACAFEHPVESDVREPAFILRIAAADIRMISAEPYLLETNIVLLIADRARSRGFGETRNRARPRSPPF